LKYIISDPRTASLCTHWDLLYIPPQIPHRNWDCRHLATGIAAVINSLLKFKLEKVSFIN